MIRARGLATAVLRTLPVFSLVALPMAGVLGWALWPVAIAVTVVAVALVLAARVPRVVITRSSVMCRGLFRRTVMRTSDITGVEMVPGRVLGKDAWILGIRTSSDLVLFAWVAFFRTDVTTPWTGTTPPPRAERARAEVEEAIGFSQELSQPSGDRA